MAEGVEATDADLQSLVDQLHALDELSLATVINSTLQARPEVAPTVVTFSIPDLTYPPARALVERRSTGTVKSFNSNNGFGFIDCPELKAIFGNDVFLHYKQIGNFSPGDEVSFAVCLSKDNKPQGYDLCPAGGAGKGKQLALKVDTYGEAKGKGWGAKGSWDIGKGWGWEAAKGWDNGGWITPWTAGKSSWDSGKKGGKGGGKTPGSSRPPEDAEEIGEFTGTIKSYSEKNGYGFIECPELKEQGYTNDVFLHHAQMGDLELGQEVQFTAFLNPRGQPQAKGVAPAQGRKRMRTS